MDFNILGPIEADRRRSAACLGGAEAAGTARRAALHANEVVSSDRLIEELWPERRARGRAQGAPDAVSRLRKALEPVSRAGSPAACS